MSELKIICTTKTSQVSESGARSANTNGTSDKFFGQKTVTITIPDKDEKK